MIILAVRTIGTTTAAHPMTTLPSLGRPIRAAYPYRRTFNTSSYKRNPPSIPSIPTCPPSIPSISTCPPSGCRCAAMPEGLAIDHERQMDGTMPPYAQHVVIRTGRTDWSSKIEDEPDTLGEQVGGGNLARRLKALVGRGGELHDVSSFVTWFRTRGLPLMRRVRVMCCG